MPGIGAILFARANNFPTPTHYTAQHRPITPLQHQLLTPYAPPHGILRNPPTSRTMARSATHALRSNSPWRHGFRDYLTTLSVNEMEDGRLWMECRVALHADAIVAPSGDVHLRIKSGTRAVLARMAVLVEHFTDARLVRHNSRIRILSDGAYTPVGSREHTLIPARQ